MPLDRQVGLALRYLLRVLVGSHHGGECGFSALLNSVQTGKVFHNDYLTLEPEHYNFADWNLISNSTRLGLALVDWLQGKQPFLDSTNH